MTEKHEDLDDVVTDEIVEQTLEEMDGKKPAKVPEDPNATRTDDAIRVSSIRLKMRHPLKLRKSTQKQKRV